MLNVYFLQQCYDHVFNRYDMEFRLRFSVVIPLYNKACFIERALVSVLAQTHSDFEIIVIDDGSADNSVDVVNNFLLKNSFKDSIVRLIKQENSGASVARNRGILESKSEYIAFLDADDEWLPDFLEEISCLVDQFPNAGLYTTAFLRLEDVTGSKQAMIAKKRSIPEFKSFSKSERAILATEYVLREPKLGQKKFIVDNLVNCAKSDRISTSAAVVKRTVFDVVGMFKDGVRIAQDGEMWLRIALKYDFAYSQRILSINHTDDAVSTTKRLKMDLDNPPNAPNLTAREIYNDLQTTAELKNKLKSYLNVKEMNYIDRLYKSGHMDEARRVFSENLLEPVGSWRKPFLSYKLFGTHPPLWIIPYVVRQYWNKIALNIIGARVDANGVWNRRYLLH